MNRRLKRRKIKRIQPEKIHVRTVLNPSPRGTKSLSRLEERIQAEPAKRRSNPANSALSRLSRWENRSIEAPPALTERETGAANAVELKPEARRAFRQLQW
jgi:hypothetical protein